MKAAVEILRLKAVVELIKLNISPSLADKLVFAAEQGNFVLIQTLLEQAVATDSTAFGVGRSVSDFLAAVDVIAKNMSRAITDNAVARELISVGLQKLPTETTAVADLFSASANKSPSDDAHITDNQQFTYGRALFSELYATDDLDGAASLLDDQEIQFLKNVTNVASASDSLSYRMDFVRLFTETPLVSELLAKQLSRNLSDTTAPVDTLAVGYGASKAENAFLSDALSRLVAFSRSFSDQSVVTEALSRTLSRSVGDSSTAVDALARTTGKQLTDTAAAEENIARTVDKSTADDVGTTETLLRQFGATRADTGLITDARTQSYGKALADSLTFSDTLVPAIVFERSFQNTASVTDDVDGLASILDDQEISFVKTNNNTLFVAETDVLEMGKVFKETASFADAGSLTNQGYCDLSYFASDYVGAVRTF